MRQLFVLCFLFQFLNYSSAQTIEHQSVNLGGGSSGMADYTIGQSAIATLYGESSFVTQGFQQPEVKLGTSVYVTIVSAAHAYPNPVLDHVNVDLQFKSVISGVINILSVDGKYLYHEKFNNQHSYQSSINFDGYKSGLYILHVMDSNGITIYTQRFVKY